MDVSYINPFITSTIETFRTMLQTDAVPGKPFAKVGQEPMYDVSGIIGLSGEAQGIIVMSFTASSALTIVSALIGAAVKEVGPEVIDGVGELANIITGNAKQGLRQFSISISLPKVVIGKHHVIASPGGVTAMVIPFSSVMGDFALEVALKAGKDGPV